ncbi:MAG: hypothetical protein M5U26_02830 [Planctomycetota bacterium]|nr:hypothetical protein [Planctomycetota bacterium]
MRPPRRSAWLGAAAALGLALALGACRKTANKVSETMKGYAQSVGEMSRGAGEQLGLMKPRVYDYVRRAWRAREEPAALRAEYAFEERRELGRALGAELDGRLEGYDDERLVRYLNLVAAALASCSDRPDLPVCVGVLRSEAVALYAVPGGPLYVTLGALRLCHSESELAGLLAQGVAWQALDLPCADLEAALAARRPGAANLRELDAPGFGALIEGEASRLIAEAGLRADERALDADRAATDLLVRLGYEPGGLKAWLARVQVQRHERAGSAPAPEDNALKAREQAIEDRLAQLAAPAVGRNLAQRFRQECLARLPAPRLGP